jgi:hypothetical protein
MGRRRAGKRDEKKVGVVEGGKKEDMAEGW